MKKSAVLFLGLGLFGLFLVKPTFLLNSANKSISQSKLQVKSTINSAFNNESLHAGIGGTWSGADKGGANTKH